MTTLLPGSVLAVNGATLNRNFSGTSQTLTATEEAIVDGSVVSIPDTGLQVGSTYRVKLAINKTAAGTATSAYRVGLVPSGEAATLANVDTVLSFTKPAGTAAADVGIVEILVTVLAVGTTTAESGSVKGAFSLIHNLAATGHATVPAVVLSAVDATTATILAAQGGGYLCLTIDTGADDVSDVLWVEAALETPPA